MLDAGYWITAVRLSYDLKKDFASGLHLMIRGSVF
jgi:hypothetical protein